MPARIPCLRYRRVSKCSDVEQTGDQNTLVWYALGKGRNPPEKGAAQGSVVITTKGRRPGVLSPTPNISDHPRHSQHRRSSHQPLTALPIRVCSPELQPKRKPSPEAHCASWTPARPYLKEKLGSLWQDAFSKGGTNPRNESRGGEPTSKQDRRCGQDNAKSDVKARPQQSRNPGRGDT